MIQLSDPAMCSGCHACYAVCPSHCITMEPDAEGFRYPLVDTGMCVGCGLCEQVCQAIAPIRTQGMPVGYAAYCRDEAVRARSSSGGVFTLLAEHILAQGGAVFGAALDESVRVRHICVHTSAELEKLRGSKYVQSEIGDTYSQAQRLLEQGKPVLFTGTPCQIDGLVHYLRKPYPYLYTQDIICHGAPSPEVWRKYVEFREELAGDKTKKVSFRDKKYGWKMFSMRYEFSNCSIYRENLLQDLFLRGFLKDLYLRPSCYACHSKGVSRNSDITLADFWDVERICPEMFDDRGTSLVLVHSAKGREMFSAIRQEISCKELEQTALEAALQANPAAVKSALRPKLREKVLDEVLKHGFTKRYQKYLRRCTPGRYKDFCLRVVRKVKKILHLDV